MSIFKRRLNTEAPPFLIDEEPEQSEAFPAAERDALTVAILSELREVRRTLEAVASFVSKIKTDESSQEKLLKVVSSFLPVMDGIENVIKTIKRMLGRGRLDDRTTMVLESLAQAAEIVYDKGLKALHALNVRQISSLGEEFDPNLHVAVETASDPNYPPHTVLDEQSKGYVYGDIVLRPAQVVVNKPADQRVQ